MSLIDLKLFDYIPKPIAAGLACIIVGVGGTYAHEARYMTVGQYTKSYVLDLKQYIRDLRKDLREAESDGERDRIREELERALDELCYEIPDDPLCKGR